MIVKSKFSSSQKENRKEPVLAFLGNPNAGKSTVFNALCGYRQKTANYPGATVDVKSGDLVINNQNMKVLDLPGLYSLQATSPDEKIALDAISGHEQPDIILNIVDVSNLRRNLFLYSQLAEFQIPIIIILTMQDILDRNEQEINLDKFIKEIGVPVVPVRNGGAGDIKLLKEAIWNSIKKPILPKQTIEYPAILKKSINDIIVKSKDENISKSNILAALIVNDIPEFSIKTQKLISNKKIDLKKNNFQAATLTVRRYKWIESFVQKIDAKNFEKKTNHFTSKIDHILTHRFFGMIIFVGIMFLVFQSIYSWSGPLMDSIDILFSFLGEQASSSLSSYPIIQSMVNDGIIAGIGSVVIFLPQIIVLFLFIALLEDSGYMARAAFLMDRLLGWAGLNGRAFIPMLSSFACAVPGVMSARVMPNERARLTTILVAPLMSCSARLPVYVLLIGALIEPEFGPWVAALTLFFFHILGLFIALPVAFFLNKGVLKTPSIPFLLELPEYRVPEVRNVAYRVMDASRKFLKQAGTIIFAMTIIIWAMSYFPRPQSLETKVRSSYTEILSQANSDLEKKKIEHRIQNNVASQYLEQSYLGSLGGLLLPVFEPLGFNWKITVGIISAFPAREVIIATFGIIYNVGEADEKSSSLREHMINDKNIDGSRSFTPLIALSLMIFFALSSQCMSTLAVVYRELKSWKWTAFLFFYMTILAYLLSFLVFQGGLLIGFE